MNANYAEICMVGNLGAEFQQVPLFHFFWKFTILLWNINKWNSGKKKAKNIFLDKNFEKSLYNTNCICQTNFWRILILG